MRKTALFSVHFAALVLTTAGAAAAVIATSALMCFLLV